MILCHMKRSWIPWRCSTCENTRILQKCCLQDDTQLPPEITTLAYTHANLHAHLHALPHAHAHAQVRTDTHTRTPTHTLAIFFRVIWI